MMGSCSCGRDYHKGQLLCSCGKFIGSLILPTLEQYLGCISAEKVFSLLTEMINPKNKHRFRGRKTLIQVGEQWYKIKLRKELEVFRRNPKCATCPRSGVQFLLFTRVSAQYSKHFLDKHLNIQLVSSDLMMMNIDHIVPKSKGGSNELDNYQTMCFVCNTGKADFLPDTELVK